MSLTPQTEAGEHEEAVSNASRSPKCPTVLVVGRGVPTDKYPLRGIFEFDQSKALAQAGCRVFYAGLDIRSLRHPRPWGLREFQQDNVHIFSYNLPGGKIGFPIKKFLIGKMLRRVYRKIITEYAKPDLIHAHFPEIGYGCLSLVSRENIPFVYTEHFSRVLKPKVHPQLARAVIGIYEKCDLLITVSSSQQKQLEQQYGVKSTVISNTVDTETFRVSSFNEEKKGPFAFIAVGSLEKGKNMDLLIEAFKKAFFNEDEQNEHTKEPKLHIVGDGSQHNNLKQLINDINLSDHIILHGLKDRHEIADLFAQSDCFILVSKAETFGVVYIEAMVAGLPIIASKCGGPESFVNTMNGKLVGVDDVEETAKAMVEMVRDRYKRYDELKIRDFAVDHFSAENVSRRLIQEYESLLIEGSSQ